MEMNISSAQQALSSLPNEKVLQNEKANPTAWDALAEAKSELKEKENGSLNLNPITNPNANANANANSAEMKLDSESKAERMQLINEEQVFNSDFNSFLAKWNLQDAGFGYNLCAVLGSQSTGKSTLLNALFGTSFDVMSESQRRQTTKGIWMCRGMNMNVLIMDVEGTDGRERGEDQDFERKSALFSMASAEVLMVNMWEHQVGLYQGANMGLLKTVFEVNLSLFQAGKQKSGGPKDKTLLLFIIRDHVGSTPLENLQATIMADLMRIWDGLSKPEGLQSSQISDFFDFAFTTLPHKLLLPAEFDKQVVALRQRFVDSKREDFVFKTQYHKRIPADGLPMYLQSIWDQVMTNKDLDLPTQQELLAQFRCDEIANAAFGSFNNEIKGFRRPIELGNVLDTLGESMGLHRATALASFDKAASRYHQEVYKRKRLDLLEKLNTSLSPLFIGQLKNLHKTILSSFKSSLIEKLRGESYDFASVVSSESSKSQAKFLAAGQLLLLEDTEWGIEEEFEQLKEDMKSVSDTARVEETKKMLNGIEKVFKKNINEFLEIQLGKPDEKMWDRILVGWKDLMKKSEDVYLKKAKSFNCTEEENKQALATLSRKSWLALRLKIEEQTSDTLLMSKLRGTFEEKFRYDDEGVPRVWKPDDDIDGIFRKSRDETLSLIPLYSRISPSDPENEVSLPSTSDDPVQEAAVARGEEEEFDFPSTLTIFSESRKIEIGNKFRKESDIYYVEAKRSTISSIAQVPIWMYGLLALLGWNEAMAILFNPIYFSFLIVLLISAYAVWKLNLSGPLLQVSKTVTKEVYRMADSQMREHFSQPLPQPSILREEPRRSVLNEPIKVSSTSKNGNGVGGGGEEIELKERKLD